MRAGARIAASGGSRAFGLRTASADPELESLLGLARWLGEEIDTAVALSAITGPEIRRRFPAGKSEIGTIPCRSGLDLKADMSDIFAASAAFGRLQEADDFEALMSLVEPGAVVIDVGANFGLYAAHAALYAGETGAVFAFEPMPEAYELLAGNIADNGLVCRAVRAAVGAGNGVANFRVASDSSFSGLKDTGRSTTVGTIEVEVIALDAFAPLARLSPDVIKIDVEGGEQAVLAGARKLLTRARDVVVMFEFSYKNLDGQARAELIAELDELACLGFELYCRTPDGSHGQRITPAELQGKRSENLFMVRPESPMAARLKVLLDRPPARPNIEQAAAIAILRRFDQLWRLDDGITRLIAEAAEADFALAPAPDALAGFQDYRAAAQQALAGELPAPPSAQRLAATEHARQLADRLNETLRRQEEMSVELDAGKRALNHARDRQARLSESLQAHREHLAKIQAKYERASAARDLLLGQIAELKARHGVE